MTPSTTFMRIAPMVAACLCGTSLGFAKTLPAAQQSGPPRAALTMLPYSCANAVNRYDFSNDSVLVQYLMHCDPVLARDVGACLRLSIKRSEQHGVYAFTISGTCNKPNPADDDDCPVYNIRASGSTHVITYRVKGVAGVFTHDWAVLSDISLSTPPSCWHRG